MKKVAIYYETRLGRNDGPPLYWCNAMKKLGYEVTHLSSRMKPMDPFDLHVWVDWGEDALVGALPYKPINMDELHPSMYVTSDTHLGYDYRMTKAKEFDYVFCNQVRAVEEFARDGVKAEFMPHAVEPQAYPNEPVCIKKYDIGFIGFVSFEKRARMLDELFREFPDFFYGQRLFEEAAEVYRKSKIVFNTAADDDINMRVFEVCGTGAFLLTEWVPTLHEIGEDGVHFVTYNTMEEAKEKAHYYLEHEDEREAIALAGMKHILANHTYSDRIQRAMERVFGDSDGETDSSKQ